MGVRGMWSREKEEVRGDMCKVAGQRAELWMFGAEALRPGDRL